MYGIFTFLKIMFFLKNKSISKRTVFMILSQYENIF